MNMRTELRKIVCFILLIPTLYRVLQTFISKVYMIPCRNFMLRVPPGPSRPRWFTQPRARSFAEFCTLHIGYMVKLHIWSILSRSKVGSSLIKLIGYMVYGLYGLFWMDKTVDHGVGFSWGRISDMQCNIETLLRKLVIMSLAITNA